jgi:hypothetical protein
VRCHDGRERWILAAIPDPDVEGSHVSERNEAIARRALHEGPWNRGTPGQLRQAGAIPVEQVA